jgi:16S rRNA (cytidine1402-2'-O)-methyltransferase
MTTKTGTLYLVATPIGNLGDITFRAVETLRTVDLIACEDTRHTQKLLTHLGISKKTVSYHEHNEAERAAELGRLLEAGQNIAVVSDAGTPAICDPSFRLVEKAYEIGAPVVPLPGAVAFINALIASGFSTDSVFFGGFLPSKKSERVRRLREVADIPATLVFYETPHRIAASLRDCAEVLGDRTAAVARELTKLHEEFIRGSLTSLGAHFEKSAKGEMVLVIARASGATVPVSSNDVLAARLAELESDGFDRRAALKVIAKESGLSRSEVYRRLAI